MNQRRSKQSFDFDQFANVLQTLCKDRLQTPVAIDPGMFVRDVHPDTSRLAALLTETSRLLNVPISSYRIDDLLKSGTYYNLQDVYDEFQRTILQARAYRERRRGLWVAYLMVPITIYGLIDVHIYLTFFSATIGSAIWAYYYKRSKNVLQG